MASNFDPHDKFQFDRLTTEIFHDLVIRAEDDTLVWDAVIFRRDYGKHLSLIDQLVANGFVVHDVERNTYRLHFPFFRLLEGVYFSRLLADINSLMGACRNHYRTWFDDPVTIRRLSEQSEMSFDHVKTIARYLQWAGFLAIPRGALDGDSRLLVNEYVLEPSSIEEWMDKQLLEFNVDKITFDPANQAANTYSTPLIALLGDAIRELYMGQDRSALPEKNDLTQWLQSKTIDGKKLSKAMCDAFYQILKAPDRRRAPPRRRSSDLVEDSNPQQGGVEVETKEPAGSVDIATKTSKTRKKTSSKKVAAKKSTAKKASTKKTSTKKTPAKKLASKKSTAKKKATSKKASAKKTPAKKVSAKKVSAKKVSKKKATAKKTATKKKTTSKKTTARKSATQKTSNSEIENTSESSDKT